jgi:hypothetical protein
MPLQYIPEFTMTELSPKILRHEWSNAFAREWNRLVEGRCDLEEVHELGLTLARVVGDQPPEAIAAKYLESEPEPEEQEPDRDPLAAFTDLAVEVGIIKRGDRLDEVQVEFAFGVVEFCAAIGDRYGDPSDGNAGEHIRAVYGPV